MDTPVTYQANKVQRPVIFFCIVKAIEEYLIFLKFTFFNCYIYSFQLLVHYAAGTQVQVAYFTVSHLTVR